MGKSIPYSYRLEIVNRRKTGVSYATIAKELGYSISGIRKIWYNYQKNGEASLETNYKNCGRTRIYSKEIEHLVNEVRDNQQGGAYVRSKLEQLILTGDKRTEALSISDIPHERTLQRWWQKSGTNRKKGKPSNEEKKVGAKHHMRFGKLMEKNK